MLNSCLMSHGGDEEFVDILEERRRTSDLGHALRSFKPHPYRGAPPCSAGDLSKAVLASHHLRYVMKEIAAETGSPVEALTEEARGIVDEMSQNIQLGFIRLLGYMFTKVLKRVFSSVFVNMDGLNMLQQAIQESPVVLMPNHRSYVDFLVISYILFTYDLPVSVTASGIPLVGMKMVGEMLRRSGAFFIRRNIGSDKLYWAVLSEYVKTMIRRGFAPVEFYVEGLRSRTLKSLTPKLGMIHMVLEPFLKGEVYDVTLVPISISYDRVVEESLLAHELLGVPKPKESTRGLLKASSILHEAYGSMHVNFGRPLSVRQLCQGKINRCQYNLVPRDLPQVPSAAVQAFVNWLAHMVVRVQEEGTFLSPWSLMACVLLQAPATALIEEGFLWSHVTEKTIWLRKLAVDFGARLNWPTHIPESAVMAYSVALHHSIVCRKAERLYLVQDEGNQSLHVFVRPALLAVAMHVTKSTQRDEIFSFFCFLRDVFSSEFIFIPGKSSQDFEEACFLLKKCGAIDIRQQEVTELGAGLPVISFLRTLIQPFMDSYQVMLRYLCERCPHVFSEKQFLPAVRSLAAKLILSGELHTYEALSSGTQKNLLSALRRLQALTKLRADRNEYRVNKAAVRRIQDVLCGKIPPEVPLTVPEARL